RRMCRARSTCLRDLGTRILTLNDLTFTVNAYLRRRREDLPDDVPSMTARETTPDQTPWPCSNSDESATCSKFARRLSMTPLMVMYPLVARPPSHRPDSKSVPITQRGKTLSRQLISDMRHSRRSAAGIAAVAVLAAALVGCSPSEGDDQKVITIFGEQSGQMDLNTNSFTLLMEKKFDVDIQFETTGYESGAANEARQVSLAGGDLPEAYMLVPWASQFNKAELQRYGDQGLILPLNDLIDKYAPNIA